MAASDKAERLVYVGTYTQRESHVGGKGEGIYLYRFNTTTGAMALAGKKLEIVNPSFLVIDPEQRFLYCVNEVTGGDDKGGGAVSAFMIDAANGALELINQQSTQGLSPCHLALDSKRRCLLVSNYGSGSVCVLPIQENGGLGPIADFIQHEGSSVNPQRQQSPHPHSVNLEPGGERVYVPDLGLDKVMIYELDVEQCTLKPYHEQPWARVKSGAGPRHLAFHPSGRFIFVANELDSTVTVFAVDETRRTLREVQTVSAIPEDFGDKSWCADIHVHPSGKVVYVSNRGHDSIAVFRIDETHGTISLVERTPTQGKFPRNFALDPTGRFLVAANQNSDDMFVFHVDVKSGKLSPVGERIEVGSPVCVRFLDG